MPRSCFREVTSHPAICSQSPPICSEPILLGLLGSMHCSVVDMLPEGLMFHCELEAVVVPEKLPNCLARHVTHASSEFGDPNGSDSERCILFEGACRSPALVHSGMHSRSSTRAALWLTSSSQQKAALRCPSGIDVPPKPSSVLQGCAARPRLE